jgi:hypothetical protein
MSFVSSSQFSNTILPAYNDIIFGVTSNFRNREGFKYIVQVFKPEIHQATNTITSSGLDFGQNLGTLKLATQTDSQHTAVNISKLVQNSLSSSFAAHPFPFERRYDALHPFTTRVGVEFSNRNTFKRTFVHTENGISYVAYEFDNPHNLRSGDVMCVFRDNPNINGIWNGWRRVHPIDSHSVRTTNAATSSFTPQNETGYVLEASNFVNNVWSPYNGVNYVGFLLPAPTPDYNRDFRVGDDVVISQWGTPTNKHYNGQWKVIFINNEVHNGINYTRIVVDCPYGVNSPPEEGAIYRLGKTVRWEQNANATVRTQTIYAFNGALQFDESGWVHQRILPDRNALTPGYTNWDMIFSNGTDASEGVRNNGLLYSGFLTNSPLKAPIYAGAINNGYMTDVLNPTSLEFVYNNRIGGITRSNIVEIEITYANDTKKRWLYDIEQRLNPNPSSNIVAVTQVRIGTAPGWLSGLFDPNAAILIEGPSDGSLLSQTSTYRNLKSYRFRLLGKRISDGQIGGAATAWREFYIKNAEVNWNVPNPSCTDEFYFNSALIDPNSMHISADFLLAESTEAFNVLDGNGNATHPRVFTGELMEPDVMSLSLHLLYKGSDNPGASGPANWEDVNLYDEVFMTSISAQGARILVVNSINNSGFPIKAELTNDNRIMIRLERGCKYEFKIELELVSVWNGQPLNRSITSQVYSCGPKNAELCLTQNKHELTTFRFLNRYGAYDYVTFTHRSDTKVDIQRTTFDQNRNRSGLSVHDIQRNSTVHQVNSRASTIVHSDWLSQDEADWLEQLFTSPDVSVIDRDNSFTLRYKPVVIKSNTLVKGKKENEKLIMYTIEYEDAYDKIIQNG